MRRVLAIAALVWGWSSIAEAKPSAMPGSGDLGERGRVFFDLETAYWQGTIYTPRMAGEHRLRNEGFGVFGYRRIPFGLGAAYAFSEWWLLGARLHGAVEPSKDGSGAVGIRGSVGPFLQVFFLRDRNVRPFALVRAAVGRSHTVARSEETDSVEGVGPQSVYPSVGVGLGSHVFITETISFDGLLSVDHRWNFLRSEPEPNAPRVWDLKNGTITAALTFGFSHWF